VTAPEAAWDPLSRGRIGEGRPGSLAELAISEQKGVAGDPAPKRSDRISLKGRQLKPIRDHDALTGWGLHELTSRSAGTIFAPSQTAGR
jgi:hypothetical protein